MEYLTKISPAIPILRAVKNHIKWQIRLLLSCGTWHTSLSKEKDVFAWQNIIISEGWLIQQDGRTFKNTSDRAKDIVTDGVNDLFHVGSIQRWWQNRSFVRSTEQRWLVGDDKLQASVDVASIVSMDHEEQTV